MLKLIRKLVIGVFLLSGCLYSCKSSKGTTGNSELAGVVSPDIFSSRLKLTIPQERKKKQTLNGSVKMVRDELIQISLVAPVLRTEAVRIEVTPDEMLVIDRINRQYAVTPAADLHQLLGNRMDYKRLQNLLSNAVFLENDTGWNMKEGNAKITIPVRDGRINQKLTIELNRISVPAQKPMPVKPPSRYERKELRELIQSIQTME
jgi:hypothetical protein